MAKLKLGPIVDEKPIKITAELPAAVHRNLLAYTDALSRQTGQAIEAAQLIGPMLARFMAADRAFSKVRNARPGGQLTQAVAQAAATDISEPNL